MGAFGWPVRWGETGWVTFSWLYTSAPGWNPRRKSLPCVLRAQDFRSDSCGSLKGRVLAIRALGDSKLTNSLGEGHTQWVSRADFPWSHLLQWRVDSLETRDVSFDLSSKLELAGCNWNPRWDVGLNFQIAEESRGVWEDLPPAIFIKMDSKFSNPLPRDHKHWRALQLGTPQHSKADISKPNSQCFMLGTFLMEPATALRSVKWSLVLQAFLPG